MTRQYLTYLFLICFSCFHGQSKGDSLIVFIGQKIVVTYSPQTVPNDTIIKDGDTIITNHFVSDSKFYCKYKTLKFLNGHYRQDTIEFYAFDHYGIPAFTNYETVLLFVSPQNGKFYHQKYQFFDLYKTADGRWAGPYSIEDYNHAFKKEITVKPEIIKFIPELTFDISKRTNEEISIYYPSPLYNIKDGKAYAIYGNFVEDLFLLRKQTYLKARGLY